LEAARPRQIGQAKTTGFQASSLTQRMDRTATPDTKAAAVGLARLNCEGVGPIDAASPSRADQAE
jgi:hypothetical protein